MLIIPAINCLDFNCVKKRLDQIEDLGAEWAHIDIADGKFASVKTWNEPKDFIARLQDCKIERLKTEVHLMVEEPGDFIKEWLEAGANRIIIHIEAVDREGLRQILERADDAEIGLALKPETSVQDLEPYLEEVHFVQVLGVAPGFSGQEFQTRVIEKIKWLNNHYQNVKIEVDGGVNLEVARLVWAAGADIAVSASYIFDAPDPKKAYQSLVEA